jgi:hypothetical protein
MKEGGLIDTPEADEFMKGLVYTVNVRDFRY